MKTNRGFTLIELLVVIAVIGVLSTFITANFLGARSRARDVQRKSDLRQLQASFEMYRADASTYPAAPLPNCGAPLTSGTSTYIQKIPCDPLTKAAYIYVTTGTTYNLVTCLENVNDPQKDPVNNTLYCAGNNTSWSHTMMNP